MLEIKNNKYVFLIIKCGVKLFVLTIMDQEINHFAFLRVLKYERISFAFN